MNACLNLYYIAFRYFYLRKTGEGGGEAGAGQREPAVDCEMAQIPRDQAGPGCSCDK